MSEEIAMNNPIVVFFDPTRTINSWTCPVQQGNFPIGWTQGGTMHTPAKDAHYCVLLLDDTIAVPGIDHANKDPNKPLLIVPHNGSMLHRNPESDSTLTQWGRPYICPGFSHLSTDEIFKEIMVLFDRPASADEFANKRLNAGYLGLLDNLAAICQMKMLNSTVDTENLMGDLLGQLGLDFSNTFRDALTNDGYPDWPARLAITQKHASTFAP